MSSEPSIETALRTLREETLPAMEDAAHAAARRERVVPVLAQAIAAEGRARRTRRLRARIAAGLAVAAAIGGIAVGMKVLTVPSSTPDDARTTAPVTAPIREAAGHVIGAPAGTKLLQAGASRPASAGDAVGAGTEVVTAANSGAQVATASGVEILLEPDTSLVLSGGTVADEHVVIARGAATFHVPPGDRARTFSVRAPRATVVVHGTRFRVAVRDSGETDVTLAEGVISILDAKGETRLEAPAAWRSDSEATATPSSSAPAPRASSRAEPAPKSDLAEQNRLFEAAMAAKRRGDDKSVVTTLDSLLARWPDSPLAEEARRERGRAVARLGH